MALQINSTNKELQEILSDIWKDSRVNALENLKLRKCSDLVADGVKDSPKVVKKLMHVQMLVDLLVDKFEDLSQAVYEQNIHSQKTKKDKPGQESTLNQTHARLDTAASGNAEQLVAIDDRAKQELKQQRESLINAVEYQIAYVVVAAEATIGRLQI